MSGTSTSRTNPTVSVIVPLYQKEATIARALDSILRQTFTDFEVVIVDDGSTDRGPDVVRHCDDPRVRLIPQANVGPGGARNRGIRESAGRLVAFLDADDEWLPTYLEASLSRLDRHPTCQAIASGRFRGPQRASLEPRFRRFGIDTGPWRLPPGAAPREVKRAVDFFCSGTTVCYREVLECCGSFYSKDRCTYGEDSYLWLQVLLNHEVYRDPVPLMWVHSEASQLGLNRRTSYPPYPVLLDPGPVRDRCPVEYRELLERCLCYYAVLSARRRALVGDVTTARELLQRYRPRRAFSWGHAATCVDRALATSPVVQRLLERGRRFLRPTSS
ncbi:MAG: glycosyltransferase [bacterium]|nr:glycosyltransferase [bacterium]